MSEEKGGIVVVELGGGSSFFNVITDARLILAHQSNKAGPLCLLETLLQLPPQLDVEESWLFHGFVFSEGGGREKERGKALRGESEKRVVVDSGTLWDLAVRLESGDGSPSDADPEQSRPGSSPLRAKCSQARRKTLPEHQLFKIPSSGKKEAGGEVWRGRGLFSSLIFSRHKQFVSNGVLGL